MPAHTPAGQRRKRPNRPANRPANAKAQPARGPVGRARAVWRSFSGLGVVIGALFLAASLTPSLIPRSFLLQGVLAGACFAIGYAVGAALLWLWEYLQLPIANRRLRRNATWAAAALAAVVVVAFSWRAAEWQNSIRERVDMPPVHTGHPLEVMAIAAAVALVLILVGRLFLWVAGLVRRWLARHVPERISKFVGLVVAIALFWGIVDGVLIRAFLNAADELFATRDALLEPEYPAPTDPLGTGSAQSLVDWEALGRAGREFVASGPTAEQIAAFTGRPAERPLRIYVGLNSAETVEERAELALAEMIRVGAFDREVLVVTVPTGTGWMDPAAMDTLEYLHDGDTAIVGQQYSYLTSWISLLVEPGFGTDTGRALFRAVYAHWTQLPRDARPRLYLHGLSLGAYGSEQSARLHEMIEDPVQGALWSGPPFSSPIWSAVTRNRNEGTPEWLPEYGDGSIVRFTNQENHLDIEGATWGPLRIVYLQYASDPITFFTPDALWRKPDWMNAPTGPDVSPELRWYPVITLLQLGLDMAIALAVPIGHGHYYAPQHYVDAWVAVTEPQGWTPAEVDRLKAHVAE
jgi:uncharacterized membrane protein